MAFTAATQHARRVNIDMFRDRNNLGLPAGQPCIFSDTVISQLRCSYSPLQTHSTTSLPLTWQNMPTLPRHDHRTGQSRTTTLIIPGSCAHDSPERQTKARLSLEHPGVHGHTTHRSCYCTPPGSLNGAIREYQPSRRAQDRQMCGGTNSTLRRPRRQISSECLSWGESTGSTI